MSSVEQSIQRNRTSEFSLTLLQADGTGVELAFDDVIRIKVGRGNSETPLIDLSSAAESANGSKITITDFTSPAKANVRFTQGDSVSITPGPYEMEILVVDASEQLAGDDSETSEDDTQIAIKHAQYGILHVIGTLGGDIGL